MRNHLPLEHLHQYFLSDILAKARIVFFFFHTRASIQGPSPNDEKWLPRAAKILSEHLGSMGRNVTIDY